MASITKHRRSRFWTAIFRDEKGIWRRKSTKLVEKGKARKLAESWEEIGQRARERMLVESGTREVLNSVLGRVCGEQIKVVTTRGLFDEWLQHKKGRNQSDATTSRYTTITTRFLKFIGDMADSSIEGITTRDCQKHYDYLISELKLSPKSAALAITVLGGVFIYAVNHSILSNNPWRGVEKIERTQQVKRMVFTPAQVKLLLDSSESQDWRTAIVVGFYTGLRLSDISNLEWSAVDFVKNTITVQTGKTGQLLVLPMHKVLADHLQKIAGDDTGPIMKTLAGVRADGAQGLSNQFKAIMRAAGVSSETVQTAGKAKLSRLSFHSLRATCNSSLFDSEVGFEVRKKIVGHSSQGVNERYTVIELNKLKQAVDTLPVLDV